MTELGLLPEEWETVRLGDVVDTVKGRKPDSLVELPEKDSIPYLTADCFRTLSPSKYVRLPSEASLVAVRKSDIVFIWDGSNAGDVFSGLDGILASTMVKVSPAWTRLEGDFLYFFLKTQFDLFNSKTTGSTVPHVSKQLFQNLIVPLPPLPEQKSIAGVLSTIQKAIETQDKVIAVARELKKSLMKHLFTYGPVPIAEADKVMLKETEIGPVPERWEVVKLESIVIDEKGAIKIGPFGSQLKKTELSRSGIRVYGQENLIKRDFALGNRFIDGVKFESLKKFEIKPLDVLVTMMGTVGHSAVFPEDASRGIIDSHLIRIRVKRKEVEPMFLKTIFEADTVRQEIEAQGHGVIMKGLNTTIIKNLLIPVPPRTEQREIVHILSSADGKIGAEENLKSSLQTLFKTMSHHLMTGKVRVEDLEATAA